MRIRCAWARSSAMGQLQGRSGDRICVCGSNRHRRTHAKRNIGRGGLRWKEVRPATALRLRGHSQTRSCAFGQQAVSSRFGFAHDTAGLLQRSTHVTPPLTASGSEPAHAGAGLPPQGCYTCIVTQITKHQAISPKQASRRSSPIDKALNPELFKALSDPTRVKLLACLAKCGRGCSVTEVAECCSVDFSVVSRHLALLADAGVLEARKEGRTMFYQVEYETLCGSLRALADAIQDCRPDGACCGTDCKGKY